MESSGKSRRQWWGLVVATVLIALCVGLISHAYALRHFLNETQARGQVTLRLAVASIRCATSCRSSCNGSTRCWGLPTST